MYDKSANPGKLIALVNQHHGIFVNVEYKHIEPHVLKEVEKYEKFYTEYPEEVAVQGDPK